MAVWWGEREFEGDDRLVSGNAGQKISGFSGLVKRLPLFPLFAKILLKWR